MIAVVGLRPTSIGIGVSGAHRGGKMNLSPQRVAQIQCTWESKAMKRQREKQILSLMRWIMLSVLMLVTVPIEAMLI
tara:strand:+ start:12618 stop:12848 length:231 start_codon:yes stop_codon:yes gene_type:complete